MICFRIATTYTNSGTRTGSEHTFPIYNEHRNGDCRIGPTTGGQMSFHTHKYIRIELV